MKTKHAKILFALLACLILSSWTVAWASGGTTLHSVTLTGTSSHGLMTYEGGDSVTPIVLGAGEIPVGTTSGDPSHTTITQSTGITVTSASGSITIANAGVTSVAAGAGISVSGSTGGVTISTTSTGVVTAKTANYVVLAADTGTMFTTTGAAGEVDFTLPTAVAGQWFTFYSDATQVMKVVAPASTTIQMGSTVSTTAGAVQPATAIVGPCITIKAISSTKYIVVTATSAWTAS